MPETLLDVNSPEGQQDVDPSTTDQTTDDPSSEDVKTPAEEGTIPYERFKEVNDELKNTKEDISSLREEMDTLKALATPPEEEEEPADWKEAEQRAVKKALATMRTEQQKSSEANQQEEKEIEQAFSNLSKIDKNITPEVRTAVLKRVVQTGESVYDAFVAHQSESQKQTQAEQRKQGAFVPPAGQGTEAKGSGIPYAQLKKMSLDDMLSRQKPASSK